MRVLRKNDIFGALFKLRNQYGPYSMGLLKLNVKKASNMSRSFEDLLLSNWS